MATHLCQYVQASHNSQDFFTLILIFSLSNCMICTKEYGFAKPDVLLIKHFTPQPKKAAALMCDSFSAAL